MRDWEQLVGERIGARFVAAHPEVVCELASHLRETCEDLINAGMPHERAERQALAQVASWIRLRNDLERAREGDSMKNQQIRSVWLPGLLTVVSGFGLFNVTEASGALRSWILQSRVTAVLPLPTLHNPGVLFAISWVAVLPLAGALGAFVSWRAGGRPGQRVIAALFPALVIAGLAFLFLIGDVLRPAMREGAALGHFVDAFVVWFLFPAISLTLGTLPFLRLSTLDAQRG